MTLSPLTRLYVELKSGQRQLTNTLPVYADENWNNPEGVWSWDSERAIVGTCRDDLELIRRSEVE